MKKYRRYLPSLDALVFFEAAARHNSFTQSASELYVTQAAVSKRIRELESRLGRDLFHRDGRRISLTDTGRRFYQRVSQAMEFLEEACRLAAEVDNTPIRIAANRAISLFWLAPRLRRFGLGPDSADVSLSTSDKPGDTLNYDNDLVITYGYGDSPGWRGDLLFEETLVPVAAPGYLAAIGIDAERFEPNQSCRLLEYERLAPDWVNWRVWLEQVPGSGLEACERLSCRNYAQAIGAAVDGQGLALGSLGLIDDELRAGRLCVLDDRQLRTGRGYYLAWPERRPPDSHSDALRQLLLEKNR